MTHSPRPLPESAADRRTRQLAYFRRLAELAMRAADIAGEQIEVAHRSGEPGATERPTLDLDPATLSDELLGMEPRVYFPDARSDTPRPDD